MFFQFGNISSYSHYFSVGASHCFLNCHMARVGTLVNVLYDLAISSSSLVLTILVNF